jgi:hypothetical protein
VVGVAGERFLFLKNSSDPPEIFGTSLEVVAFHEMVDVHASGVTGCFSGGCLQMNPHLFDCSSLDGMVGRGLLTIQQHPIAEVGLKIPALALTAKRLRKQSKPEQPVSTSHDTQADSIHIQCPA